jgi:predicted acylesterase/phospholipase RssA
MIHEIMFGCGGPKGILFVGAMKAIVDVHKVDLSKVTHYGGVSIGSCMALIFSLGLSPDMAGELFANVDMRKLTSPVDIISIITQLGGDSGERLVFLIQSLLKEIIDKEDISFAEHHRLTGKKLTVQATNLTRHRLVEFSHETHPGMSVVKAIRMSCSVPVLFTPVEHEDDFYIDGGLMSRYPKGSCSEETLIVAIRDKSPAPSSAKRGYSIGGLFSDIIYCLFQPEEECPAKLLALEWGEEMNAFSKSMFPDQEGVQDMIDRGYCQAANALIITSGS